MPPVTDTVRLVAQRTSILAALQETARTKRELATELDVSRSTIDRSVRELEQAGFLERAHEGLKLTLPGELVLDSFEKHAAELAGIEAVKPILGSFRSDLGLPPDLFRNPVVHAPNRHAPHRPSDTLVDLLADATEVKHYATGIRPEYGERYWGVVQNEGQLAVVATAEVVTESLRENRDTLTDAFETGNFTLAETEESRPYSIVIADDADVCVLVYDDHALQMVVRNDNSGTVSWALDTFETLQQQASVIRDHATVE